MASPTTPIDGHKSEPNTAKYVAMPTSAPRMKDVMENGSPRLADAEHHYYEPDDCFTRHLESAYADRAVRVVEQNGERRWMFGDHPLSKAAFARDRVLPPGASGERRPGQPFPPEVDAHDPAFTSRADRLRLMDAQDTDIALVLPSMAYHVEHDLRGDPEAGTAAFRAFNRWVEEDWGYAHEGRIFGVPYIPLLDVPAACSELERVLANGARAVEIKSGPVGRRSPAHPDLDPFWARIDEADVPVVMHLDNGGYTELFSTAWGERANPDERHVTPFQWATCYGSRPFQDSLAQMILWNLFGRFPRVRLVSLSCGCDWIPAIRRLDAFADPTFPYEHDDATWWPGGHLDRKPSELLRSHVSIAPFVYEDVAGLCELMGTSQVLMASDYPHPEGFDDARKFRALVQAMPDDAQAAVLHDNLARLLAV
jgi:predicted TIM-barrel fold metal-dependent hydrolase